MMNMIIIINFKIKVLNIQLDIITSIIDIIHHLFIFWEKFSVNYYDTNYNKCADRYNIDEQ